METTYDLGKSIEDANDPYSIIDDPLAGIRYI